MELIIDVEHRGVRCLYDGTIDLAELVQVAIERASHVESDSDGDWWADLSPVDGPLLGPYGRRTDALATEAEWLCEHYLLPPESALGDAAGT